MSFLFLLNVLFRVVAVEAAFSCLNLKSSRKLSTYQTSTMSQQENDEGASSSSASTSIATKSWLTRSLGALMQLPKSTPLAALKWTSPEGPMPKVIQLPSRDAGRTIEIYIWVSSPVVKQLHRTSSSRQNSQSTAAIPNNFAPPIQPAFTDTKRPCLIDFHGGGFIMGGPLEQAPWCAAIARSGIVAISVAYRLGPTWEFPAALHDAEDVVRAVLGGSNWQDVAATEAIQNAIDIETGNAGAISIDTSKIALSGFSSGGNVALNMLLDLPKDLLNSDTDWPSPFSPLHSSDIPALLFFPSLDARQASYERSRPASMAPPGAISRFIGRNLRNAYLPSDKVGHLRASPGLAPISSIHGSSRALLILPEMDTLAEQSETWVAKLKEAGIVQEEDDQTGQTMGEKLQAENCMIRVHRIKGMSHGFTTFPDSFIDLPTRKAKQLVMEQARRWIVGMLGGDAGDPVESQKRVEAIVDGDAPGQGVKQPTARLAKAVV